MVRSGRGLGSLVQSLLIWSVHLGLVLFWFVHFGLVWSNQVWPSWSSLFGSVLFGLFQSDLVYTSWSSFIVICTHRSGPV